jgi:predicted Rossmann fold flavoprotein
MTETQDADLLVVGAGAAGLMAAIWAARTAPEARILALDGARKVGAKILVSGGARCNVTHERVTAEDFNGASRNAVRKVLARFDVARTVAFFEELGVVLKREETGKLFPVTDDAHTVLRALLDEAARRGVRLRHPCRVERAERDSSGAFHVSGTWNGTRGEARAPRLVLAAGGRSLPRSGSDGGGYALARALGHTITPRVFPALVPLLLPGGHPLRSLAGLSAPARLTVRSASHKRLAACEGSTLCTHFGVSGPAVLDVSRHWIAAGFDDPGAALVCDWLPDTSSDALDAGLRAGGAGTVLGRLRRRLPERLAAALCTEAGVDPATPAARLSREQRRTLVRAVKEQPLPVTGDRGWNVAEVTAGGVPLTEVNVATMESRATPGLYLCGEILDVDGRIGGFNFQWAWASGYVAGLAAGRAACSGFGTGG